MSRNKGLAGCMALCLAALLTGCSGGGGDGGQGSVPAPPPPPPPPAPPPPPPPALDFSAVETELEAFPFQDVTVLIGDETGVLYTFERGAIAADTPVNAGSAAKLIFGLLVWDLVEAGTLSRADNPQDYLDFWTRVEPGGRSGVTLDNLFGLVSGFNDPPQDAGCIGDDSLSLVECVRESYEDDLETLPGDAFYYGPEHMQIAAAMIVEATGQDINTLLDSRLSTPLGLSADTAYPDNENTRYAGAIIATPDDYGKLLAAVLDGRLVSDRDGFLEDRTPDIPIVFRPGAVELNMFDWHYGFGFWKECDLSSYQPECNIDPTISSPGGFGFTPWIDFDAGYWGVIAIEERPGFGSNPSQQSVQLEQALQPLIEAAIAE